MQSERIKAIEAAARAKGMDPEDFIKNEQEMARLNQGALKDQVVLRRKQMDIGQTLDTTIQSFSDLNKVTASLTSQFDRLLHAGPTPAGGRPTTGPAPTVGGNWWNFGGIAGGMAGGARGAGLTGKPLKIGRAHV